MNKAGFFIFRCEQCGQQWLTQRFCCHRECAPAPQRLGSLADSMNVAELINFSIVLPLNGSTSSIRKAVGLWLKRLAGESFEFIFVAHSSPVGLFNYITEIAHTCTLRLLRLNARTSLGRSYNLGAQAARGRFLVLTESGIPHLPYSFPEAFEVALADARVGLVGFGNERQQLSEPAPPSHDRRYRFSSTSIRSSVVGLKSEVFWELGGIDERFSTYTMAMKDLQYRLIRSNYRLAQARLPRRSARRVSSLGANATNRSARRPKEVCAQVLSQWGSTLQ